MVYLFYLDLSYFLAFYLTIKSSKEITFNGVKTANFIGEVKCKAAPIKSEDWIAYVYGYVFVMDGIPVGVIGIVSAPEQDPAQIAEVTTNVDLMMQTLRAER